MEKRPRSPNPGDQKLIEVAKSQASSSPGEAAKAMEAETSPCSQKADCSGVASGGSGGGCSTVAESASASLGPSTSPEREEEGRDDGKGREKRPRSPNPGDQKLIEVAKSQASSSPGEAAKAMEAETSPCSQNADCSGGSGGGCSTVAESASASLGPSTSPEREEEGRDDGKGREKRPRSANAGDQKLIEIAKSQASSSPGEAAKAMEAETLPCSRKADYSGVASSGSSGGCSMVAESASASLGPSTSMEREEEGRDDGKGKEKRPRSANPGDQKLIEVAKSQASSPGEAAKAVEAETSPFSQKADCSGVASGGSGGGCSTVAESTSASLGPFTSPEREEEGRDDGKGRDPGTDQKLIVVAKSQASSSPGEAAKAMEAETSPCSQKADCSGDASGGSGGGCSTVAESASAEGIKRASPGPSVLEAEEDVGSARVPTEVEKTKLAIMSRQSITVPLRLDARER